MYKWTKALTQHDSLNTDISHIMIVNVLLTKYLITNNKYNSTALVLLLCFSTSFIYLHFQILFSVRLGSVLIDMTFKLITAHNQAAWEQLFSHPNPSLSNN